MAPVHELADEIISYLSLAFQHDQDTGLEDLPELLLNTRLQSKEYWEYSASIRTVLIFWIVIFLIFFSGVMMYRSKFNSFQKRDHTQYSGRG